MRSKQMKEFVKAILQEEFIDQPEIDIDALFDSSPLLRYIDLKTGAIYGNSKSRRSLGNIYAIYAILHFYQKDYYNKPEEYRDFEGYEYTKLFAFYRSLYGGNKLQNHALNSRVNGEFKSKIVSKHANDLIINNSGKYEIHIDYLYADGVDLSKCAIKIIEEYINLLQLKDNKLLGDLDELIKTDSCATKKAKLCDLLDEKAEARIFEIISYSILKNHYSKIKIYIGYTVDELEEEYLALYKTGRTNANDGGIDFVLRPLGRFFQVTEVNNYDKYLLDIDKVLHFPITFVIKTINSKEQIEKELEEYIEQRSGGMRVIKERYQKAIEEIITINELKEWLEELSPESVDDLIRDINLYYHLELNLPFEE